MALTKYFIAEQIQRLLESGDPKVAAQVHINEIKAAINNVVNSQLKAEHFSVNLPSGETIPSGLSLCTYENVAVSSYKNKSKSVVPVMPVSLPRNMGVYEISKTDDVDACFIPYQSGQFAFIKTQPLISDILGQIGYEVSGRDVIYSKDLTAGTPAISAVTMRLVVMDVSKYTDFETLPISADQVWPVINEVYKLFSSEPVPDKKIVDSNESNK